MEKLEKDPQQEVREQAKATLREMHASLDCLTVTDFDPIWANY